MLLSPTFPDPLSSLNNLIFPETVDHLAIAKTVHRTNHLPLSDIKKIYLHDSWLVEVWFIKSGFSWASLQVANGV